MLMLTTHEQTLPSDASQQFYNYLETLPDDRRDNVLHLPEAVYLNAKNHESAADEPLPESSALPAPFAVLQSRARHAFGGDIKREIAAETAYADILDKAVQGLQTAREAARPIATIFVPGTEYAGQYDYCRRLLKLAQDTGTRVVTRLIDMNSVESLRSLEPPRAASIEGFWAEQEGRAKLAQYVLGPQNTSEWRQIAELSPTALQTLQLGKKAYNNIKELAYGDNDSEKKYDDIHAARLILAKLDDPEGYEILRADLEHGRLAALDDDALGAYLAHGGKRFKHFMRSAKDAMEDSEASPYYPIRFLTPLSRSQRLKVGVFLSKYLVEPAANSDTAVRRSLPDVMERARQLPYDLSHARYYRVIGENIVTFLARQNEARDSEDVAPENIADARMAGDLLLGWPAQERWTPFKEVLGEHLLKLYVEAGSVVTCRDKYSLAHYWARDYMAYRSRYGDLPEISQQITIIGE